MPRNNGRYKKYSGYAKDALGMSHKALQVALATKRLLNVERKILNVNINGVAITDAGLLVQCSNLLQGDNVLQRDGDQVKCASVQFSYTASINASATNTTLRIIMFVDRQPNGAVATLADILNTTTPQINMNSPYQLENKYRFKMLYDKRVQMSITGRQNAMGKFYRKVNFPIRYGGNAGTIADSRSNSIGIFLIGNEATNDPVVTLFYRMRFIDN